MYDLLSYSDMLADEGRVQAYASVLKKVVCPESVVLEIGTGTGFFALLACRYGAKKIYAIESNDVIQIARELAAANGMTDRINFIQGQSTSIDLPEKVDIIISDLRGRLPLYMQHIPTIIDARERFLLPNGIVVPQQDTLYAALFYSPNLYQRYYSVCNNQEYGLDMQLVWQKSVNNLWGDKKDDEEMLTDSAIWATLNYRDISSPDVEGNIEWMIEQDHLAHGFRVWFDSQLYGDTGFSNAPDQTKHIYGSQFFPLLEPVELEAGDTVSVSLQANMVGNAYIWQWQTQVFQQSDSQKEKVNFRQSNFQGVPFSNMHKRAAEYQPTLNDDGLLDFQIMDMMRQDLILEDISQSIVEKFPARFRNVSQALAYVGELSLKYSH